MSYCCICIVKDGKVKYTSAHYSYIRDMLQGKANPDSFMNIGIKNYSDTLFIPAVIINFDENQLINTDYNWFDDFRQYLPSGWAYRDFKTER